MFNFMLAEAINPVPLVGVFAAVLLVVLFFSFVPVRLWISALASNVRIGIMTLIGMKLRRVRPENIVNPLIKATKAGLSLQTKRLEAHYLAGGNVDRVVNALVAAQGYCTKQMGSEVGDWKAVWTLRQMQSGLISNYVSHEVYIFV